MKKLMLVTAAALAVSISVATAENYVGIAPKIGTLGLGADVTVPLVRDNLNLRAGFNWADIDVNMNLDEAKCTGTFDWLTFPILLDWHPAGGEFRVSGGAVINNNEVKLTATPNDDFKVNGSEYPIERMDGSITFDQLSWYIGIGSGNAVGDGRVHFVCDFGIMFHGKPKAEATATASNPEVQSRLDADLQKEVDDFQKDLDKFIIYPVLSVGVSFAF